jgi:hypothetical protein
MAYYGSQDSMAMYYRNMGLEPDGVTPLAPAPSPVPTPMPAAGAAGPAFQPQPMAGAAGPAFQPQQPMAGVAGGVPAAMVDAAAAPRPDFGGEMQPRPAQIQERQMYGDRDRYRQDRQHSQNPAFTQPGTSAPPQAGAAGAAGPLPQPSRPMGPRQSPERGPMSASSTMGGNPQNTRPRQPNPAMPPPGQPMRGPRRSTPMGS